MESICEVLVFERQYQIPAATAMNRPTRTGATIFQSLPGRTTEASATFKAPKDVDGASAGEEPDAGDGGWTTGELPSCATAAAPELAAANRPVSVSRFSRCRSARISEAC